MPSLASTQLNRDLDLLTTAALLATVVKILRVVNNKSNYAKLTLARVRPDPGNIVGCKPYKEQFIVDGEEDLGYLSSPDDWKFQTPNSCIDYCRKAEGCKQWEWRENNVYEAR